MERSSISLRTITLVAVVVISVGLFIFQAVLHETLAVFVDQSTDGDKSVVECYILDEDEKPQKDKVLVVTTGQEMEEIKDGTKLYVYHLGKIKDSGDKKTVKAIHITVDKSGEKE